MWPGCTEPQVPARFKHNTAAGQFSACYLKNHNNSLVKVLSTYQPRYTREPSSFVTKINKTETNPEQNPKSSSFFLLRNKTLYATAWSYTRLHHENQTLRDWKSFMNTFMTTAVVAEHQFWKRIFGVETIFSILMLYNQIHSLNS